MDKTTQRLMSGKESIPPDSWIAAYDFVGYGTNEEFMGAAIVEALQDNALILIGSQASVVPSLATLNKYCNITSSISGGSLAGGGYLLPKPAQNSSTEYYITDGLGADKRSVALDTHTNSAFVDNGVVTNNNLYFGERSLDSSGNIYVGGEALDYSTFTWRACFAKTNSSGAVQWIRVLSAGTGLSAYMPKIHVSSPTGVSYAVSPVNDRVVIVQLSSSGVVNWQRTVYYSAGASYPTNISDLKVDSTGANIYIVVSGGGEGFCYVLKISSAGSLVWQRGIDGENIIGSPNGTTIALDSSNNVFITVNSNNTTFGFAIIKINSSGTLVFCNVLEPNSLLNNSGGSNTLIAGSTLYVTFGGKVDSTNNIFREYMIRLPVTTSGISAGTITLSGSSEELTSYTYPVVLTTSGLSLQTTTYSTTTFATNAITRVSESLNAYITPTTVTTPIYKAYL